MRMPRARARCVDAHHYPRRQLPPPSTPPPPPSPRPTQRPSSLVGWRRRRRPRGQWARRRWKGTEASRWQLQSLPSPYSASGASGKPFTHVCCLVLSPWCGVLPRFILYITHHSPCDSTDLTMHFPSCPCFRVCVVSLRDTEAVSAPPQARSTSRRLASRSSRLASRSRAAGSTSRASSGRGGRARTAGCTGSSCARA